MVDQNLSDFQIGYDYVRNRQPILNQYGPQQLWELGKVLLLEEGAMAELSRGMAFYCLEKGLKKLFPEIIFFWEKSNPGN